LSEQPLGDFDPSESGRLVEAGGVSGAALPDVVHALARRRKDRKVIQVLSILGDSAAIVGAFSLGATIWYGDPVNIHARETIAAILPAYLLLAVTQHAFTMSVIARGRTSVVKAGSSLLLAIGLIGLVAFFLQAAGGVSRAVVGLGGIISFALIACYRAWLAHYAHRRLGDVSINEVVIQDGVKARVRPGSILLDASRDGISLRLDSPSMLDRLGRCLQVADRVIVACHPARRALWVSALKSSDVNAEILAEELDDLGAIGLDSYNGTTTVNVASAPLGLPDRALKRSLDLVLVLLALPVLLPFMILVAIAIKLDSKGPVFFRQPRVGLGNRMFQMYKFRSMRVAQNDVMGSRSTSRNDDRITRAGRIIRKTSIDELPQILNVLLGDMSIVGPRPHPLECKAADRLFWDIDRRYWHRHAVKPGMTGLAQIRGFRGATEEEVDLTNRLQADLEYVAGWSIWRDISIIVATFRVLTHRNAF
jgi:exopolysaccharide biosynthesis polyprenyl glycosylphosphotransferase